MAFDFDGTLSEIVLRPDEAELDPALAIELERSRPLVLAIAVVSGRDQQALSRLLPPHWLAFGSYGLELPPSLAPSGFPPGFDAEATRTRLRAARVRLEALLPRLPAVRLEVKTLGLAMHLRGAPGTPPGLEGALHEIAVDSGLELTPGRLVYELRPRGLVDKGWVLRFMVDALSPSAVVYAGDDLGDIPAWEALRQLPGGIAALSVGVASSETSPRVLQACDLVLAARSELLSFCALLRGAASGSGG
ncbi:MAG: trehalose-phosphatase [Candidatus Dormibacteria bacterium]